MNKVPPILVFSICLTFLFSPAAAQERERALSAWDLLLRDDPTAADDPSISWEERLILHVLTPAQAGDYFSGRMDAEDLVLQSGQSLEAYLQERLNPPAHVYIPLASPCPLFELQSGLSGVQRLQSGPEDLSFQGGSSSGCAVSAQAGALLINLSVQSVGGLPARIKVWSPEGPEPTSLSSDHTLFPLSYETVRVVPICRQGDCAAGEFDLKLSEAALVRGELVGYFRPLASSDQTGGNISLFTEGSSNNFFGTGAGDNNTGTDNSFFGGNAGNSNTSGSRNSFFGKDSGMTNTIGADNSFFGQESGLNNTTGSFNSFFGQGAGTSNTEGSFNSFFGEDAGFSNTTASANSFFGQDSGRNNTTGEDNSFFGQDSGFSNTSGSNNSFFGEVAGTNNTTGANNTFIGESAGLTNTTENNNTLVGAASDVAAAITNATAIGYQAQVSQSDSVVLGSIAGLNGASTSVRVGIGTATPAAPLHVLRTDSTIQIIRAQSTGPETVRNMMDLVNNGIAQFRLIDTSANGDAWQFSNTDNNLNISLQGSGSQEFLIENDGDVFINNGTVQVTSSREKKENFKAIDSERILNLLSQLEITEWNYKKDPDSVRHIGPVSEDFYRLFGVGDGEKHISPTDLSGVALAAVQGLLKEQRQLKSEFAQAWQRLLRLESRLSGRESSLSVED